MPLDELARLFAGARAVVGLDTGLTHLAAALGVPTVGIYCGSDPALTGLYGARARAQRRRGRARRPRSPKCCRLLCVRTALHPRAAPARCRSSLLRLWWRGRREPGYREHVARALRLSTQRRGPRKAALGARGVGGRGARRGAAGARAAGERCPTTRCVMTCTTAAGRETLKQVYGESVHRRLPALRLSRGGAALPRAFPAAPRRADGDRVWPNLLARLREQRRAGGARQRAPVGEVGARLPALARARRAGVPQPRRGVRAERRPTPRACARSARARVEVTGNLKFDVALDAAQLAAGREWQRSARPAGAAARQHARGRGGAAAGRAAGEGSVPRRGRAAPSAALRRGRATWAQSRRSRGRLPVASDRVHLGDTMGEMAFYYAACDVAVIGGSFLPLGGQNLIEALAAGAPVVFGPSMFNFAEATRLALEAGAAHAGRAMRRRRCARRWSCSRIRTARQRMSAGGKGALRGAPRRDAAAPRRCCDLIRRSARG